MPKTALTKRLADEQKARRSVAQAVDEVTVAVVAKAQAAHLAPVIRDEVERIARRYFRGRVLGLFTRFTPEEARFLHLMLLEAAAEHPRLRSHLKEYARYLGRNYRYEWTVAPCTGPLRQEARDLMLRQGDSSFGDTPLAPVLAFVRYHHRTVGLLSLTSFGTLYNRAQALQTRGHLANRMPGETAHWEQLKAPEHTAEGGVEMYGPEHSRRPEEG